MEALALSYEPELDDLDEPEVVQSEIERDERVMLHGVGWADYLRLLAMRGERSVPRITYVEGTVELMSPSIDHAYIKTTIGRILEAWALRGGVRINGYGSWTIKNKRAERGAEPDECYILGSKRKRRPDLAIEVVWTHGGLDKLDVYLQLKVREVWIWEDGRIGVHVLIRGQYVQAPRSRLLPQIDLVQLANFATVVDQFDAVNGFLAAVGQV